MIRKEKIINRFSTVWAIEDPIDELFHFIDAITGYKPRFKSIVSIGLLLALSFFAYVIIALLLKIFEIGNMFLFSQTFGTYYLIESSIELIIHLLILPFSTIVILFLLQSWKFFEVFLSRLDTLKQLWDEKTQQSLDDTHAWNPMQVSMMLLGEIEQQTRQVKKHILLSSICLLITAGILSLLAILFVFYGLSSFDSYTISFNVISPLFLFIISIFFLPFLYELYQFIGWQHKRFTIISSIYSTREPRTHSSSSDCIQRLKSYLEKDTFLNDTNTLILTSPFTIHNINFDLGGVLKNKYVFVRKSSQIIPSDEDISRFYSDIKKVIQMEHKKPTYVRAMYLLDWRDEEGEIPEILENQLFSNAILLRRDVGGSNAVTYIQLIIDYGTLYSMVPLVPEKIMDD